MHKVLAWLLAHKKAAVDAWQELLSRPLAEGLTILMLGLMLALPSVFYVGLKPVQLWLDQANKSETIYVYAKPKLSEDTIKALSDALTQHTNVASVVMTSAEEAHESFIKNSELADVLIAMGTEPLPVRFDVSPSVTDINTVATLVETLKSMPNVDVVHWDKPWRERIGTLMSLVARVAWLLSVVLMAALVLVLANTVVSDLTARAQAIRIMFLVGASKAYVRRPLLYRGCWLGALSALLAWCMVWLAFALLRAPLSAWLQDVGVTELENHAVLFSSMPMLVLLGCALGLGAASIGAWRYFLRYKV